MTVLKAETAEDNSASAEEVNISTGTCSKQPVAHFSADFISTNSFGIVNDAFALQLRSC